MDAQTGRDMAAKGTSIKIFLVDGTPDGLRLIEKSLWTGIGLVCSRNQYPAVRKRDEFGRPGIYVLTGPDPAVPGGNIVYIGQAELARQRLDQHSAGKDFWTHLVLFTNKDANLNNAHFRYLEARLIQRANQAKRANLANGNQPSAPQLAEAEVADAEAFLSDMLVIYPLVGIDAFEVATSHAPFESSIASAPSEQFVLTGKGATAKGKLSSDGFLVVQGSTAAGTESEYFEGGYLALRQELKQSGVLASDGALLRFTQDYLFKSPSAAGAVVLGRNTNGRRKWKTPDGQTLAQVQAAQLGATTTDDLVIPADLHSDSDEEPDEEIGST
jgi:hypothetical protein